jgi:hypothetical protein
VSILEKQTLDHKDHLRKAWRLFLVDSLKTLSCKHVCPNLSLFQWCQVPRSPGPRVTWVLGERLSDSAVMKFRLGRAWKALTSVIETEEWIPTPVIVGSMLKGAAIRPHTLLGF